MEGFFDKFLLRMFYRNVLYFVWGCSLKQDCVYANFHVRLPNAPNRREEVR